MKIALIFDKIRPDTIGNYVEKALKNSGHQVKHFSLKDAAGLKRGEYDLFLRIDHGSYESDLPAHLKPKAFWVLDTHLKGVYDKVLKILPNYDFIFCGNKRETETLKRKGFNVAWVSFACEPDIHKKLDLPKGYDVGYVGNDGGIPRKFVLQAIKEEFLNSFIGRADFSRMSEIYGSSKVGFNYSYYIGPHNRTTSIMSMRFFEIMACGCFLLTSAVDDGSIEDLGFENGRHLAVYKDESQIFELINYYLKNENKRREIVERGYELVVSKHTYKHRVEQMLKYITS